MLRRRALILLAIGIAGLALPQPACAVDDAKISDAITRMKQYLYTQQRGTRGTWEAAYANSTQAGGETALVTLALLMAGDPYQLPALQQSLKFLSEKPMHGTYAVGLRASVWAQLPDAFKPMIERDGRWLLQAHHSGLFGYESGVERFDHSTTQYGVLGLWEAAKRHYQVPPTFWSQVQDHFVAEQNPDGGWGYQPDHPSTGSMTAAGVTVLLICQQQLYRQQMQSPEDLAKALERGLAWLDKNFVADTNPGQGGNLMYYLYSVERAALASGLRQFNQQNWYEAGVETILKNMRPNGSVNSNTVDTAFALMFMRRAQNSVWISKLALPGSRWNNRPNDLHFLSQYLSDLTESEQHWQVISVHAPLETWLTTPVVYIASDRALSWTRTEQDALKAYLEMGGTLFANPDTGSGQLGASIRLFAATHFPTLEFQRLPRSHPIYDGIYDVPNPPRDPIFALNNGVRDLIYLVGRDWGFRFQADEQPGEDQTWAMMANFWAHVTNRGVLPTRLAAGDALPPAMDPATAREVITIGRARYDGVWNPEPRAWERLGRTLQQRTGLAVMTETLELHQLHHSDLPMVHLAGVEPFELTPEQLFSIDRYLQEGGTLLVETVGGKGGFARAVEQQFADLVGYSPLPLGTDHAIVNGEGLKGAFNARHSPYRRYSVLHRSTPPWPQLAAFRDPQTARPTMIISDEDLSLGYLGVEHWGILGYEPAAARRLGVNLLLWAHERASAEKAAATSTASQAKSGSTLP